MSEGASQDTCPLCGHDAIGPKQPDKFFEQDLQGWKCETCGRFGVSEDLLVDRINRMPPEDKSRISAYTRSLSVRGKRTAVICERDVSFGNIEAFRITLADVLATFPDNVGERLDAALLNLAEMSDKPGVTIELTADDYPVLYAEDHDVMRFLAQQMQDLRWVELNSTRGAVRPVITTTGWNRVAEIQRGESETHAVFMAMPFSGDYGESVKLFYRTLQPALEQTGFHLTNRLLDEPKAGLIDDHLRVEIRKARFLIVDLTGGNQGAYWEAGFSEGLGKKVIYTCRQDYFEEEGTHFDTGHLQTVEWEEDKLGKAAEDVKAVVRNTFPEDGRMSD